MKSYDDCKELLMAGGVSHPNQILRKMGVSVTSSEAGIAFALLSLYIKARLHPDGMTEAQWKEYTEDGYAI